MNTNEYSNILSHKPSILDNPKIRRMFNVFCDVMVYIDGPIAKTLRDKTGVIWIELKENAFDCQLRHFDETVEHCVIFYEEYGVAPLSMREVIELKKEIIKKLQETSWINPVSMSDTEIWLARQGYVPMI